ncbi:MAG: head-tail connector protein [Pseudomonadota bacterium]
MRPSYALTALTDPAVEPIGLAELKTFLRITHDSEDTVLGNYIRAARMFCENYTGKSFITRSYKLAFDVVPRGRVIEIPRTPLVEINSVKTFAADGSENLYEATSYDVDRVAHRLCFKAPLNSHGGLRAYNALEINFDAGYGTSAEDIPEAIRQGVLIKTAELYEHRGDERFSGGLDLVASLLRPYKRMRIA